MSEGKRKCIEDIPDVPLPPDWNNFQSKDKSLTVNYGHIHLMLWNLWRLWLQIMTKMGIVISVI